MERTFILTNDLTLNLTAKTTKQQNSKQKIQKQPWKRAERANKNKKYAIYTTMYINKIIISKSVSKHGDSSNIKCVNMCGSAFMTYRRAYISAQWIPDADIQTYIHTYGL